MIVVYGKGKTGEAVKRFLDSLGKESILIDDKDSFDDFSKVQMIVVSPGVPFYHNIYSIAKKNRIPIISEIELADKYYKGKKIAITGTDGKTTTTSLIYHILKEKRDSYVGGNYGIPFVDIIQQAKKDSTVVLELSSFQLYSTVEFKPDIAVWLNISKDHLDWHKKFSHYCLSKAKITKNQGEKDTLILNWDDEILRRLKSRAKILLFSLRKLPDKTDGVYLQNFKREGDCTVLTLTLRMDREMILSLRTKLIGLHNASNIMASLLATYISGLELDYILHKIESFEPLPHRIEFVRKLRGVSFYNDSKATTVQAVMRALESFDGKIVLILGGINKGGDFSTLGKLLSEKVKGVFIIGSSKEEIYRMVKDFCPARMVNSLEEAVKEGLEIAEKSDTVLLSPGCASFDMFKNYADRGERFREIVRRLNG